jgi:ribosome-associated translation inhibitor RaiA
MTNRIHFHDLPHSQQIKDEFEKLATGVREEFPEIKKLEVSLNRSNDDLETHVHVTGKDLDLASSAKSRELRESLSEAFERLRKQLRKRHDKVIYSRRRVAQKAPRR